MKKKIDDYLTLSGSECLLSCFYNYCNYQDIGVSESDIFIIGGGLKTQYSKLDLNEGISLNLATGVHDSVARFSKKVGIRITYIKNEDDKLSDSILDDKISMDQPVIIQVDPGYLKYSFALSGGFNLTHFINVIGVDEGSNLLLISDGFIPTYPPSTYQGWCCRDIIRKARKPKKNLYLEIDTEEVDYNWVMGKKKNLLIIQMIRSEILEYLNGGKLDNHYCGNEAMKQFTKDISQLMDLFGEEFTEKIFKLNYELKIYGVVASRKLLFDTLVSINRDWEKEIFMEECNSLESIIQKWNSICFVLVRVGILKRQDELTNLSRMASGLVEEEENILHRIYEKLSFECQ